MGGEGLSLGQQGADTSPNTAAVYGATWAGIRVTNSQLAVCEIQSHTHLVPPPTRLSLRPQSATGEGVWPRPKPPLTGLRLDTMASTSV